MNSRSKGSRYERKIAKEFSLWAGFTITRTPMSGGYNKGGDLTPKDPEHMKDFPLHLELKHREGWDFNGFLKNPKHPIWGWWEQCEYESRTYSKVPIVVFTKNLDLDYCITKITLYYRMKIKSDRYIIMGEYIVFLLTDLFAIPYNEVGLNLRSNKG